jgi:hypothetical protein
MKWLAASRLCLAILAAPLAAEAQPEREYNWRWWWGHPMREMWAAWAIVLVFFVLLFPGLAVAGLVLRFAITVTYWGVIGQAARRRGLCASLARSRCRSRRVKDHWNGVAVAS